MSKISKQSQRLLFAIVLGLVSIQFILAEKDGSNHENTKYCDPKKSADSCSKPPPPPCLQYDAQKFKNSPSIFTYFPEGRLGNKISAYLYLLWLKLDFGLDVYYEKESFDMLDSIFANVRGTMKVLEDSFCDWREFGFEKYEGDVEKLGLPEWSFGKAVRIYIDRKNFMRHEIQGGRKYVKEFRLKIDLKWSPIIVGDFVNLEIEVVYFSWVYSLRISENY